MLRWAAATVGVTNWDGRPIASDEVQGFGGRQRGGTVQRAADSRYITDNGSE